MNFSGQTKLEIIDNLIHKPCCLIAFLKGLAVENAEDSSALFKSENKELANALERKVSYLIKNFRLSNMIETKLELKKNRLKDIFIYSVDFKGGNIKNIELENLSCEDDRKAFLEGAFIAHGSIINPEKGYLLEFSLKDKNNVNTLSMELVEEGYIPKLSVKKLRNVLYFKEYEIISEILAFFNAPLASLNMTDVNVEKEQRNRANRRLNCDQANIDKQIEANLKQTNYINKIIRAGKFGEMPEDLKKLAEIRLDNPTASLSEICRIIGGGCNRSSINYKFKKIENYLSKKE